MVCVSLAVLPFRIVGRNTNTAGGMPSPCLLARGKHTWYLPKVPSLFVPACLFPSLSRLPPLHHVRPAVLGNLGTYLQYLTNNRQTRLTSTMGDRPRVPILGHFALVGVSERRTRTDTTNHTSHVRTHVNDCLRFPHSSKGREPPGAQGLADSCVLYDGAEPAAGAASAPVSLSLALNLPDRSVEKLTCVFTRFPELPGSGYPVAEAVPIGTAVLRSPLSSCPRRTHQSQCESGTGKSYPN